MKVSKRFVLVLVQVLEERTGTVLRVIFFFSTCSEICMRTFASSSSPSP